MITQDYLKSILNYNPETGIFTRIADRSNMKKGSIAGTFRDDGYITISIYKRSYYCHRLAFLYMHGFMPKCVDHINGNPSDNRLSNLREASFSQNSMNRENQSNNTSGSKGVTWDKDRNKWRAQIQYYGKTKNLGRYTCFDEAAKVALEARNRLHGEFANHGEFSK